MFVADDGPYLDMALLLLAVLLDLALGEFLPPALHPVVWMGRVVEYLKGRTPRTVRGQIIFGLTIALLLPAVFAAGAYFPLRGLLGVSDIAYVLAGALVMKSTFALRTLDRAALRVRRDLEEGRVQDAREDLKWLVGRDTSRLTPELATAAAVESVAENTTDSFVAPWLAFALFGVPGAVAYRAINTLDSMIGYRGEYEYLGKASARLDDVVNWIPARLSALLIPVADVFRPRGLAMARNAWRVMWRDHARTESPNSGWTMSSMAGSLGVQLENVGHYTLGDGGRTALMPRDITRATNRMYFVAILAAVLALTITALRHVVL